jgi:hypothetical protein
MDRAGVAMPWEILNLKEIYKIFKRYMKKPFKSLRTILPYKAIKWDVKNSNFYHYILQYVPDRTLRGMNCHELWLCDGLLLYSLLGFEMLLGSVFIEDGVD